MTENQEHFYQHTIVLLNERGVTLKDVEDLVYYLQKDYIHPLTHEAMQESIEKVPQKREVQNSIITGIELDRLAEKRQSSEPLQSIVENDEPLYGRGEVLAFSIINLYGSISFTDYGYTDRTRPGILKWLNDKSTGEINVFPDDLVGAVAAAAASRLAHTQADLEDDNIYLRRD